VGGVEIGVAVGVTVGDGEGVLVGVLVKVLVGLGPGGMGTPAVVPISSASGVFGKHSV
jgi:hypothetical protein